MNGSDKQPEPKPSNAVSGVIVGEPFNPWRRLCGFYPPDVVGRQRDLRDGPKRLYERAVRWAGQNGKFWYGFERMAAALGKSVRQVKADMSVLKARGLIKHTRRRGTSNLYVFPWHPMFEVQPTAHQEEIPQVQRSHLEVQDNVRNPSHEVQPTARESCPSLNFVKSSSEAPDPAKTTDDSRLSSEETGSSDANPLVEDAREQLRRARAAGMASNGVICPDRLGQVELPDRTITCQILAVLGSTDDFQGWLRSTVTRGLARKANSARWGLYLADAKYYSKDRRIREPARRQETEGDSTVIDTAKAVEAPEIGETVGATELDRAVSLTHAYKRIEARLNGRRLPKPLRRRFERTGDPVSPNELERQIALWKRCPNCQDRGIVGDTLESTLMFCLCAAGIEESYIKGREWPAEEMARVHTDIKSLLVAACLAVGYPFTADAIEDSAVSDGGGTLEIHCSDDYFAVDEGEVRKALGRLKLQRQILITGGNQRQRLLEKERASRAAASTTNAGIQARDRESPTENTATNGSRG